MDQMKSCRVSGFSCRFTLLAPDLLRTDSQENIYLQADGVSTPVAASITIQDFSKSTVLLQDSVTLNLENGFQALKAIQVTRRLSLILMVLYEVNKTTTTVWC